jgi:peptidoglycan/LPS O-acetylase OafA/YrhL
LGWSGVDLFFVLSGFLITGILIETLHDSAYYRNFYARRSLRIFPIYYLLCAVLLFVGLRTGAHWTAGHLWFLAYLGNPAILIWQQLLPISPAVRVTHLWSLSVEEQFYFLWPWVIRRLRSRERIVAGSIALIVVAFLARLGFYLLRGRGWSPHWPEYFILCRVDALGVGALLAALVRGPLRKKLLSMAPAGFAVCGGVLALLLFIRHTTSILDPAVSVIGLSLFAATFGFLLLTTLVEGSVAQRFFRLGGLRFFGRYSYGLYLYHFPLQGLLKGLQVYFATLTRSGFVSGLLFVFTSLLVNVLVAVASFHFIESPIMKLKKRFSYAKGTA